MMRLLILIFFSLSVILPSCNFEQETSLLNLWRLIELNGEEIEYTGELQEIIERELYLIFNKNYTFEGFGGCNKFSGSYDRNGNFFNMSVKSITKKYCGETVDREQSFIEAINKTNILKIEKDGTMTLYKDVLILAKLEPTMAY